TAAPAVAAPDPGGPETNPARPGGTAGASPSLLAPTAVAEVSARDVVPPEVKGPGAGPARATTNPALPDRDLRDQVRRPGGDPGASVSAELVDPRNAPEVVKRPAAAPPPEPALPEAEVRRQSRPRRTADAGAGLVVPPRSLEAPGPIVLSRVMPGGLPRLPD